MSAAPHIQGWLPMSAYWSVSSDSHSQEGLGERKPILLSLFVASVLSTNVAILVTGSFARYLGIFGGE